MRENLVEMDCEKCRHFYGMGTKIGEGKISRTARRASCSKKTWEMRNRS